MDLTQTHARFEDTSNTLIADLHDPSRREQAIEAISQIYWKPVYSYLRHKGKNRDQASELTQSFFVERVIANNLFLQFKPGRGKLRSYLISALKHYLIDLHRKSTSFGKSTPLSLDNLGADTQQDDNDQALCTFEQEWAIAQLEEAVRRCQQHLVATSKQRHWDAFHDRIYGPCVYGNTPTPLLPLSKKLGFNKPADVGSAVQVVNQKVLSYLREVITESTDSAIDANEEYIHTMNTLNIQFSAQCNSTK